MTPEEVAAAKKRADENARNNPLTPEEAADMERRARAIAGELCSNINSHKPKAVEEDVDDQKAVLLKLKSTQVNQAIEDLKQMNGNCLLSGADSCLENTWEEICVQVQGEQSFYWDAYITTIELTLMGNIGNLSISERHALWMSTDAGMDWLYSCENAFLGIMDTPICIDDIVENLKTELLSRAEDYENSNITRFMSDDENEDSYETDDEAENYDEVDFDEAEEDDEIENDNDIMDSDNESLPKIFTTTEANLFGWVSPALILKAVEFAIKVHADQLRKGTDIQYITHPIAVSKILKKHKCSPAIIIAGILHDTVEDGGVSLVEIAETFGPLIAEIVEGCSEPDKGLSWIPRKQHTIQFLRTASENIKIVAAADKLHNVTCMLSDYKEHGEALWNRFKRGREDQEWYYRSVVESLGSDGFDKHELYADLKLAVDKMFGDVKSVPPLLSEWIQPITLQDIALIIRQYWKKAYPNTYEWILKARNLKRDSEDVAKLTMGEMKSLMASGLSEEEAWHQARTLYVTVDPKEMFKDFEEDRLYLETAWAENTANSKKHKHMFLPSQIQEFHASGHLLAGAMCQNINSHRPKEPELPDMNRRNRLIKAFEVAAKAHDGQYRKGTSTPYIVHPLGVAMILMSAGCDDDMVIAGLLHDAVEKTPLKLKEIAAQFGERVAMLVEGCTEKDKSLPWRTRKENAGHELMRAPNDVKLVVCADKLNNVYSLIDDFETFGEEVWNRFNEGKTAQICYYQSIDSSLSSCRNHPLATEYAAAVKKLRSDEWEAYNRALPRVKKMTVDVIASIALEHWRSIAPEIVEALEENGSIRKEIEAAAKLTITEMEVLMAREVPEMEAWEATRNRYVITSPETLADLFWGMPTKTLKS